MHWLISSTTAHLLLRCPQKVTFHLIIGGSLPGLMHLWTVLGSLYNSAKSEDEESAFVHGMRSKLGNFAIVPAAPAKNQWSYISR